MHNKLLFLNIKILRKTLFNIRHCYGYTGARQQLYMKAEPKLHPRVINNTSAWDVNFSYFPPSAFNKPECNFYF